MSQEYRTAKRPSSFEEKTDRLPTTPTKEDNRGDIPTLLNRDLSSSNEEGTYTTEGDGDALVKPIPMRYRLAAFIMILFFATGSSYAQLTLSPLKSTIRKQLKITNAQYGALASADNLINTVLPIIGGIGMDYWGATYAAIISSVFVLLGTIISALAPHTGSFGVLLGGRILMGFGSTIIETTQNKLYAHWFHGSQLGLTYGCDIAWNRILGIIARSTAVPLSQIDGFWGWALWVPAIICAVNLAVVLVYWYFERHVPKDYRPVLGREAYVKEGWAKRKFPAKALLNLPMFFWIFCGTQVLQNGAVSTYTSNLADIQTQTRGTSTLAAGYNSSLQGVVPIVLTPLVGYFFDKFGWRMIFVSWTGALYVVVFALIGLTQVHPLGPILLSSFALSSNAITFLCALPVLVGNDMMLGTAMGVWKSFQNANSTIMDVAAGAIQDRSGNDSYDNVIYFIIAIKCVEVVLGPVYDYLDGIWLGHSLRMPELKRVAFRKKCLEEGVELRGWKAEKKVVYTILGQLIAMVIVAYVYMPWALRFMYRPRYHRAGLKRLVAEDA